MFLEAVVIAHRGASAYAPENTLAAFEKAAALGSRVIEFDVMINSSGDPFIFHDEKISRTTNGTGLFTQLSSNDVENLDAGRWFSKRYAGEKIPSLKEALLWLVDNDLQANIELKPTANNLEQTTLAVVTDLNRFWPMDRPLPLISSFEWEALALCRSIFPELPLGMLMHEWNDQWLQRAKDLQCSSVNVNRRILTQARVEAIRDAGFAVSAYTVNSYRLANKLFSWGVNAVFSDYPDLLTRQGWKRFLYHGK